MGQIRASLAHGKVERPPGTDPRRALAFRGQGLKTLKPKIATLDIRSAKPAPKRADAIYLSPEWRKLMAAIIAERGRRCQDPVHDPDAPREGIRVFGDHIVELKDGGAPFDRANVLLRCGACHTRKTMVERARRVTRSLG